MIFVKGVIFRLTLAGCSMLSLACKPQATEDSTKGQSLIAALSLPQETQCLDNKSRTIDANLSFTNRYASDVVLRQGLGQSVTVLGLFGTKTLSPLLQSWSSAADAGPLATATDITIHPGSTSAYVVHVKLDAELLKQPGFYKVQVSYDLAKPDRLIGRTNWAIFQVRECRVEAPRHGGIKESTRK